MKSVWITIGRIFVASLVAYPVFWVNHTLGIHGYWQVGLSGGVLLAGFGGLNRTQLTWHYQAILTLFLILVPLLTTPEQTQAHNISALFYATTMLLLLGLAWLYEQPQAPAKLGMIIFGIGLSLLVANVGAGVMLESIQAADQEQTAPPTPQAQLNSSEKTSKLVMKPNPQETPEPTIERPVAGYGYMDFEENGGEAEWGHVTGYAPLVNSVVRAYMYDQNGDIVYDTRVSFNSQGRRGEEVPYDKPDDVYRILIIGDSFVEALQVDYEQTFYALLHEQLQAHNTPNQRYEVIAVGRTGWGTLQEYLYYQVEGHRYNADLVILSFFINDVADNYPAFFYPNINNTNYEYIFEDGTVQLVDLNRNPLPPNNERILYNTLPTLIKERNLAKLYIRLADPPRPVINPGGVMTRVHPKFYIYVTDPQPEGYAEAWERTERGLTLFAEAVQENGGRFAVMPLFFGADAVRNVSGWFPELVAGWEWDDALPEKKLSAILDDLPADLIQTRPTYEAYAESVNGEVNALLYLPEDGHFNTIGHELTRDALYEYLQTEGVTSP